MSTTRKDRQRAFHEAALEAYQRHGFRSYRHAEQVTGIKYSTVYLIVSQGRIPTRGQLIEWAEGLDEPINQWLELAGYDPIPENLIHTTTVSADRVREVMAKYAVPGRVLTVGDVDQMGREIKALEDNEEKIE